MIQVWRPPFSEEVWRSCLPDIERATDYGMWTAGEYLGRIKAGHMALWVFDRVECADDPLAEYLGCMLLEIRSTPKGRVLWCEAVGGHDFGEVWGGAREVLDRIAKDNDCVFIELQGRPGFIRKLPDFDHVYVTLRRPVHARRQYR